MSKIRISLITVLLLCFFGTFALAEGNSSESVQASSMRLMQTEGNVTLTDHSGSKLALRNRMRLYSGCAVSTEEQSRAGILLDDAQAVTIAESSSAVINQEGKKLEIAVNNGKMFFDVSKPLEADESFEIRTSTMVLGIRGTAGCVEAVSENESLVTLITGHAEITCFAGDVVSIEAGQQVHITRQDDGSCEDQYVEEQKENMLRDLEWIREEHHGAIWEALNEVGGMKRNGVGDNQIPVNKTTDIPATSPGLNGPYYYDPTQH